MSSEQNPRAVALDLLRRWDRGTAFADESLHKELARSALPPLDRRLLVELFYGVIRWRALLDWVIRPRCKDRPPTGEVANLLRLGAYQILLLDRVPDHAAVHETVALAAGSRRGFTNAILRRIVREKTQIQLAWEKLEQDDPATAFSHPPFLVARWRRRFGLDRTLSLLEWNNEPPVLTARVNELRTGVESLIGELRAQGVVVRTCAAHPLCLEIEPPSTLETVGPFRAGHFYLQDPSTLLAVDRLDPQPGESVLDACAAPGGKTTYLAQKMQNQGKILATDTSVKRLGLVEENCRRLGVTIVQTAPARLAVPVPSPEEFDRILVDAPCSNTGVLRRRVDLRWRVREEEIARLARTQRAILDQAASRLRRGGRLVYSTCSLEREENEEMLESFLAGHPEFRPIEARTIFPPESGTDGAFVASLTRA